MAWSKQSRHERGYGSAWVKRREQVLRLDNYLCQPCLSAGRTTEAREVDHILPKSKGGKDELCNLQSICPDCHRDKTARDEGRSVKHVTGLDGWPA